MDEDVWKFLQQIHERLSNIEAKIDKQHTPGDCPINDRVHTMELRQARQGGIVTVVGAIAGMIAAALLNAVIFFWKR